ncbi:MAG: hypothetical protein WBG01_13515 [Bacteroidota bacterium]
MKLSLSLLLGLLLFSTSPTVSQNKQDQRLESGPDAVTVRGYILDAMCGDVLAKKQKDLMQKASKHTRKCGLAEACAASGYGVFTEGRWVKFDAEGNKLAKAALEKSTKERDLLFSVTGQMKDGLLAVATITEVRPEEMENDAPYRQG